MFRIRHFRLASIFLTLGTGAALAGEPQKNMDPHKRADKIVARMEKKLDLTKDQVAKVRKLAYEVADAKAFPGMHGGPGHHRHPFLHQLHSASVDTAALNRDMREHLARMEEKRAFLVGKFAELHAILTPEQREKLAKHMEKRRHKMRKHWH